MWNPTQISASAQIMPIMRVSISVARKNLRMGGSVWTVPVAPGAAELILPPFRVRFWSRFPVRCGGRRPRKGRATFSAARLAVVSSPEGAVNSFAEGDRPRFHAGADFRLGDPPLVD